jgi:prepilin-type N-terminal cleavage/methylation domain-containing protein
MKNVKRHDENLAFSAIELLVALALIGIVALLLLPRHMQGPSAPRINCVNNLRQVGLAFRTWALDHEDLLPMQTSITNGGTLEMVTDAKAFHHFQVLSNELATPKVLVCPTDRKRISAANFLTGFNNQNLSYFVGIDAAPNNPQMVLAGDRNLTNAPVRGGFMEITTNDLVSWTDDLHRKQGNVCLADGSVQQLSSARLQEAIRFTGLATNRLAMP